MLEASRPRRLAAGLGGAFADSCGVWRVSAGFLAAPGVASCWANTEVMMGV